MNTTKTKYIAWALLTLALLAWGAVGFLAWSLADVDTLRAGEASSLEETTSKLESTRRIHAIARETKDARASLESLVHKDTISIVEAIEAAGKDARVTFEIGDIHAEPVIPSASPHVPPVRSVTVSIEAFGSFSGLMHAASLLSSLPIASTVDKIELETLPPEEAKQQGGGWRLIMHMRTMTIADISS